MREVIVDISDTTRGVVVWGATGQAKVLRPIMAAQGFSVAFLYDRSPDIASPFPGVSITSDEAQLENWIGDNRDRLAGFVAAIGGSLGRDRMRIAEKLSGFGLKPLTFIHDRAWVADAANLGSGCQVMGLAAISEEARLGDQCIINTKASVDHECLLGDGVHVMPGATLAGCVQVGDFASIGSGATILPRIKIGAGAMIGAGAVVTRDVCSGVTVVGVPARPRPEPFARMTGGRT